MNDILKIAWRNLWRNKRRTLITAASIFFAVFFAIFMRSFQLGTYGYMIEQSIESYTGYLQIQNPDYYDDPTIDNTFAYNQQLIETVTSHPNIKSIAPRIESFALASNGIQSKGVLVAGIEPDAELEVSNPMHRLIRFYFSTQAIDSMKNNGTLPHELLEKIEINKNHTYSSEAKIELELELDEELSAKYLPIITACSRFDSQYLSPTDSGVLVSDRLSRYLQLTVGDTVVLMSQGYHGVSAAGVYPIRGIIKMASPDLDNKIIYMTIPEINQFLGLHQQVTSLVVNLNNTDEMMETQADLKLLINNDHQFAVKNWEEIIPTLKQQIEGDSVGGQLFIFILYLIVFFGIFGTVLMMIAERKREFGVMIAIGMKRKKLSQIVSIELIFMGVIGIIAGMLAITPILLYGYYHPLRLTGDIAKMYEDMGFDALMPMALFDPYFFTQGVIILLMILVACLVPLRSISKLKVIDALHG